jgi:tRNA-Thr(GGU) m(6)t(6)A37 methyltransferase TsaA
LHESEVNEGRFELTPIGRVESALTDPGYAPKQGDEGAPEASLVLEPWAADAADGIRVGEEVLLLTWLDRARRDLLRVHPRDEMTRPLQGVFSTRSADRPNPIGLHRVEVLMTERTCLRVGPLEAVHGTPLLDIKPVLRGTVSER